MLISIPFSRRVGSAKQNLAPQKKFSFVDPPADPAESVGRPFMGFGKYRNRRISEVPREYLIWYVSMLRPRNGIERERAARIKTYLDLTK